MPSPMRSVWVTKCASSRADGRNARPPAQNAGTHRCLPGLHGQNIGHAGFLRTPRTRSGERYLHGRRHPGPGVYEGSRNPRLSLGCRVRGDRSLALRFGVRGGHGCVRDIIEQVLRARGDWARDSRGMHSSNIAASRKPKSTKGLSKTVSLPFSILINTIFEKFRIHNKKLHRKGVILSK